MNIFDIINVPFGNLLKIFYTVTGNYVITLFLFALAIKIVLSPLDISNHKNQVRMAKMKPKESAIRKKYAGRTDSPTQQKMQNEIMELYKSENYSPLSGCLPMLIQLPVIFSLMNIVRNPLTYISNLSADVLTPLKEFVTAAYGEVLKLPSTLDQLTLIRVLSDSDRLDAIKAGVAGMENYTPLNFSLFGGALDFTMSPSQAGMSLLLLIPVLNFAASFAQMKIRKVLIPMSTPGGADPQAGMSGKIMEFVFPLMIVYSSYMFNSALGLYWIFQTIIAILQTILMVKIYPMPRFTEEELKQAELKYGTVKKKKKSSEELTDDSGTAPADKSEGSEDTEGISDESKEDTFSSDELIKGINPAIKNKYQKTGKKYNVKKKK